MICDQTNGNVFCFITLIRCTGQLTDLITDCFHRINVIYGIDILYNNSQTLKSHTGINIFIL